MSDLERRARQIAREELSKLGHDHKQEWLMLNMVEIDALISTTALRFAAEQTKAKDEEIERMTNGIELQSHALQDAHQEVQDLRAENERLEKKNSLALDALKKADAMHDGITLSNEVWDVEQTIGDLRKDYDRARALVEEGT